VDGLWATKSEGVGLFVREISFPDFQRYRRTDDMQTQYRALQRAVKSVSPLVTQCRQ